MTGELGGSIFVEDDLCRFSVDGIVPDVSFQLVAEGDSTAPSRVSSASA